MPSPAKQSGLQDSQSASAAGSVLALAESDQALKFTVLRQIENDAHLCREWNELVLRTQDPQVFYTYEWAAAVQRAYSASLEPLLILAHEQAALVGIAALAIERSSRCVTFLCQSTADYCDFISDSARRAEFVDGVLEQLKHLGARSVVLANLPSDSASVAALTEACRNHEYRLFVRPAYACARVILGPEQQRADIKKHVLRKKIVHNSLKHLEQQATVHVHHLTTFDELNTGLPAFCNAHVARFLASARVSNQVQPERRQFLEELTRLSSGSGWIALSRLMLGAAPIAWNYGFRFGGSWFWYQPTFDSKFEKYSPGVCLLSKIIAEACDSPEVGIVDLGLGAEGYKDRFGNALRHTLHVTISQSAMDHVRAVGRYRAAEAGKTSHGVERLARSLVSRVRTTRRFIRESPPRTLAACISRRLVRSFLRADEVVFYEWPATACANVPNAHSSLPIKAVDLSILARAAMHYAEDPQTLNYLLRSARRLNDGERGFALHTEGEIPVHFGWIAPFAGFHVSELGVSLTASSVQMTSIFDCWTPDSVRGQGFYQTAIQILATMLLREGKSPWIFSAAANTWSVRAIEKAGFQLRYSMIRRKVLCWQKIETRELSHTHLLSRKVSLAS